MTPRGAEPANTDDDNTDDDNTDNTDSGVAGGGHECGRAELSVGCALHALEPDEELAAAAHLSACGSCQELVAATHEVTAQWAGGLPALVPSPRLGQDLRARVAVTPQNHGAHAVLNNDDGVALAAVVLAPHGLGPSVILAAGQLTE
jgi:hypothetical protein